MLCFLVYRHGAVINLLETAAWNRAIQTLKIESLSCPKFYICSWTKLNHQPESRTCASSADVGEARKLGWSGQTRAAFMTLSLQRLNDVIFQVWKCLIRQIHSDKRNVEWKIDIPDKDNAISYWVRSVVLRKPLNWRWILHWRFFNSRVTLLGLYGYGKIADLLGQIHEKYCWRNYRQVAAMKPPISVFISFDSAVTNSG